MSNTAALLGRSLNRAERLTDTPIFHALAAAATPIFHATTTAREAIHRPLTPLAPVPSPRHRRPQAEAMGGLHREPLTRPLPIQIRPPPYLRSASTTRPARPVS